MTTTQPHPSTVDPFALIPGAYGHDWEQDTPPAAVPAAQTPTTQVQVVTRTRVVDCPSYAWDNSDQAAREDINTDFYSLYRPELAAAAHELIRTHLIAEWRKVGRLARLVDGREFTAVTDTPAEFVGDEQRWAVWQAAANQVSGEELVFAAGLVDELACFNNEDRDY